MSRRISSSGRKASEPARRAGRVESRPTSTTAEKAKRASIARPVRGAAVEPSPQKTREETKTPASDVLARAEADIAAAVESLNKQMSSALATLTELAVAQRGRGEAVVRTAPLDRATATFQRLVAEVVDDKLGEMLPPLIGLRNEMDQRAGGDDAGEDGAEFCRRGVAVLDQVLAAADVRRYEARVGEGFDPLIHLAVGEMSRADLAEGAVAEVLQPGFRSGRGKVLVPARVKVNRR